MGVAVLHVPLTFSRILNRGSGFSLERTFLSLRAPRQGRERVASLRIRVDYALREGSFLERATNSHKNLRQR
jgi:hypothetical protein